MAIIEIEKLLISLSFEFETKLGTLIGPQFFSKSKLPHLILPNPSFLVLEIFKKFPKPARDVHTDGSLH